MTTIRKRTEFNPAAQLLTLLDSLPAGSADLSAKEIHCLRVGIKQTRAWLKLYRAAGIDTASYQQVVAELRQLSHVLAGQRDRDVALLTLARLAGKYPGKKAQALINVLSQQIAQASVSLPDTREFELLREQIRRELPAFVRLELAPETQAAVIAQSFAKMCTAGTKALHSMACTDLHAWRKRVKCLAYQIAMVNTRLPHPKKLRARLDKLGDLLGVVHDLCCLQDRVEQIAASTQPPLEPAPVFRRIQRERHRLTDASRKQYRHLCPLEEPAKYNTKLRQAGADIVSGEG